MVNLATHELRLVAKNMSIKNYTNILEEKLLSTLDELECNFNTLLETGLKQIVKMQNSSYNDLDQVIKIQN